MKTTLILLLFAATVSVGTTARAHDFNETAQGRQARYRAARRPWHGYNYHTAWGEPVALVVPPNAEQTGDYNWGAVSSRVTRIDHQFQRPYPGNYGGGGYPFLGTPRWPSDTQQFGVYYIRGPW